MMASSWSMSAAMWLARVLVGHAHLGFQPQARQRRAQVVRDAGQHDGAVLLDLGELLRHAVEADVDLADLAGRASFSSSGARRSRRRARGWRRTTAACSGRLISRAIRPRRPATGRQRRSDPDQPGARRPSAPNARRVDQQPVGVALDREADPQARLAVDARWPRRCSGPSRSRSSSLDARGRSGRCSNGSQRVARLARQRCARLPGRPAS